MTKIRIQRMIKNNVQGGTDLNASCNRVDITKTEKCDFEHDSHLSRSLLVLVVLTCLSQSLGLQTLDQISVLPTELGRKITQSDVGTIRSIVQYLSLLLTSVWSHDKHQEQPYASP